MDEAYAVFDTLSVGPDTEVPGLTRTDTTRADTVSDVTPVLARIPHIPSPAVDRPPEPAANDRGVAPLRSRIDARGTGTHPHTAPTPHRAPAPHAPPTPSRVHTDDDRRFDAPAAPPTAPPGPALAGESTMTAEPAVAEESLAELLLKLDAAINPYSRWIALAAVVAAIGLTLVLLQGPAAEAPINNGPSTDQAVETLTEATIFADVAPLDPIAPTLPNAPSPVTVATATATGPQSAPAKQAVAASRSSTASQVKTGSQVARETPRVELTGEVFAPPSGPTPPASDAYPRTATAYPATDGSTRR